MPEFKSKDEEDAFYKHGDPRAVAVELGAIVENRLTDVLRLCLRDDVAAANELFAVAGPIGNFGTKIRLAYMMGIFENDMLKDLLTLNRIRNTFAHDLAVKDFGQQPIRNHIDNLKANKIHAKLHESKKAALSENSPPQDRTMAFILEMELLDHRSRFHMCARFYINTLVSIENDIKSGRARSSYRSDIGPEA